MQDHGGSVDDLESVLRELFQEIFGLDEIGSDSDFFELGGDSLAAEALTSKILSKTGHEYPMALLLKSGTPRLIAERLLSGKPGTERQPGTAAADDKISVRLGSRQGRALHFFHGDFNYGGISLRSLADIAGPEQQIVGIAPHGVDGEPVPATIEAMAADRLAAIRRAQPEGPYMLGGHCNGALVAFEAARLLTAGGERVDLVVMVDPLVVSVRKGTHIFLTGLDRIQRLFGASEDARQNARVWSWSKLLKLERWAHRQYLRATGNRDKVLSRKARRSIVAAETAHQRELMARKGKSGPLPVEPDAATRAERGGVTRRFARAMAAYHPEPFDVPVLCFSLKNDGRAWKRISPRTEILVEPGGHFSFGKDFSPAAVKRLRERLEQLELDATRVPGQAASKGFEEISGISANPVHDLALSYQKTAALTAAIKLDIFTLLGKGASDAAALAEATGASARGIRILCDFLCVLKLLTKKDGMYALTATAQRLLDRASSDAQGETVDFFAAPELISMLLDDPVSYVRNGGSLGLATVSPDNPIWVRFARAMVPFSAASAKRVAARLTQQKFHPRSVLDVAAGPGLYGIEIAKAFPDATITAVDWAPVLEVAIDNARAAGIESRFTTIPGSAFDVRWEGTFDLIILSGILHHYGIDDCVKLLAKARAALTDSGKVMVIDFVPDTDRVSPPEAAAFSFWMLATTPAGDAYSLEDHREMAERAGFTGVTGYPLSPTTQTLVTFE
jgi:thioesterase domain-containing protein/predicted nicotinamide N-methyase